MKTERLTDLPVRHLEYVFSPPGLPLPVKGETELGTTSILVRGGPGSGKTTFALALAHGIAKAGGGLVLYLTTEFSPVEIAFKATLIGLKEEAVDVWPGEDDVKPGDVVVEHLLMRRHGKPVLSSAERRASSMDAVWELLHPDKEGEKRPALPVRSVVIDALTLPEAGEKEGTPRADLVAFVQGLENSGVSVVLVEELAEGAAAWSAFVVDVVFELAFVADAETHELRRKLTLSKSRYAMSIPGPHGYGFDMNAPAVWPNLVRVLTQSSPTELLRHIEAKPPIVHVPTARENGWIALDAGIILSTYNETDTRAYFALSHTPGLELIRIECGAVTTIDGHVLVPDDEGAASIAWAVLGMAQETSANTCFFVGLEGLLQRPGWTAPVIHMLEALRRMHFLLCVHSPDALLGPVGAMADAVWDGRARYVSLVSRHHQAFQLTVAEAVKDAAWRALHFRADWEAARAALAAVELDDPPATMLLLWKAVCAAVSKNQAAIDELKPLLATPDESLILPPLLRGLAGTNQLDEADRILTDVAAHHGLPRWQLDRMRADTRLDSDDPAALRDAATRLQKLATAALMPPTDHAVTWHNLGTAHERLGERDAALAAFEQALALDPNLAAAHEGIERLRAPAKPSPS